MKRRVLAVGLGAMLIFVGACSSPTAPISVAGTWGIAGRGNTPGPFFSMTLTQSGDSIGGTGVYEPVPGMFRVSGLYTPPCITLVLTYDKGTIQRFSGLLLTASEMSGNAAASGCSRGPVDYSRG